MRRVPGEERRIAESPPAALRRVRGEILGDHRRRGLQGAGQTEDKAGFPESGYSAVRSIGDKGTGSSRRCVFSLSLRGTSGERVGERGNPIKTRLLSPALSSSSVGREGEERGRFP